MQDGLFSPNQNTPFEEKIASAFGGRDLASMQNQVDPETALRNKRIELDNISQQAVNRALGAKVNPLQPTSIPRTDIDISGRFPYQVLGEDNEDLYSQNQTWGGKAANGILKGLALMGTTFLQGTVGTIVGLGNLVSGNGLNSFYNNDFSNWTSEFNKKTENWLPNYYGKQEREARWYEPDNWFTANFLFDKFAKNLGFSIGAIYSGAAITKALKLIGPINSLFTANKAKTALLEIESKLAAIPATERLGATYNILMKASNAANSAIKMGTQAERFVVGTLGAATEGGIEALQGLNEYRNAMIDEYSATNGYAPTGAELERINEYSESLGNARFGMNMALLSATNYVMLPKILGSSYKTSKSLANQEINNVVKNAEGKYITSFSQLPKPVKFLERTRNIGSLFFSLTEGGEELGQYAIERGVNDYYNKAYRGEGRNFVESLGQGIMEAVNSDEGMEQFLIGALSGGIQQAGFISSKGIGKSGKIAERGFRGQGGLKGRNTENFLSFINNPENQIRFKSDSYLRDMATAAARGVNLQEEGEAFIRQGDVLEAKDNEADYMHNYLAVRIKHGRYDLVKDDIAHFQQQGSTQDGLDGLKQQGIANENDTIATFAQRTANFARHADNVNSLYQSLNLTYSGVINRDTKERIYSDEVIDKMVYAASKIADYDQRIPELSQELLKHGIVLGETLDSISEKNIIPEKATKDALEQINKLNTIDEIQINLKSDLRDVIELAKRRKFFINEYKNIKSNPSEYTEIPQVEREDKATIRQRNEEGKSVKTEVELNKEYSVESEPLFRDGNKIVVNPKLTILSKTLGGEYEVKMPDDTTKYMRPNELKDYKLTQLDQNNEELNKIIHNTVYNILKQEGFGDAIKAEDSLQDLLSFVNTLNNNVLVNKIQKAVRENTKVISEEIEKSRKEILELRKNEELKKQLEEQQKLTDSKTGILTLDDLTAEQIAELEKGNFKKAPLPAFLSKEADYQGNAATYTPDNVKPHQKRRLSFLTNLARIQGSQQAATIKVAAITANNEASFGLSGLINWVKEDLKSTVILTDRKDEFLDKDGNIKPEMEPIVKLYVRQTKEGLKPVGIDGKTIENTTQTVISDGIFGVFDSEILGVYKFGPTVGQKNYSGEHTEDDVKKIAEQFKQWRQKVLASTTPSIYSIADISRGIVLRDENNKPVTDTQLAKEDDLDKEGLIVVPTKEGQIVINDTSYNFPVGYPLLVNGSNVDFLNNRKFTEQEANDIYELLKKYVTLAIGKQKEEAQRLKSYLSSILYMGVPKEGAAPANSQIYYQREDTGFNIHFGTEVVVPFTIAGISGKSIEITNYLKNYYVKTNNKILTEDTSFGFEQAYLDGGEVKYKEISSYQRFLLEGQNGNSPFLQTKARKSVSDEDPTIISRYTTLRDSEFAFQNAPIQLGTSLKRASLFGKKDTSGVEKIRTEVRAAISKAGQGEGGQFIVTLLDGTKENAVRISLSGNELGVGNKGLTVDLGIIKKVENPDGTVLYDAELAALEGKKEEDVESTPKGDTSKFGFKKLTQEEKNKIDQEAKIKQALFHEEDRKRRAQDFKGKKPSLGADEFSIVDEALDYSPIDIEKELSYIKDKSPFSTEILKNIIQTSDGIFAWGKYKGMLISLYDKAIAGTGYHELFEGVWSAFTTKEYKAQILTEFRNRKGYFTAYDGKEYTSLEYKYATDAQAKEKIADEFAEYVLIKDTPLSLGQKISKWFKDLWNMIESIFNGKIGHIDNIFKKINRGDYKSASPLFISQNDEYSFADLSFTQQSQTVKGITLSVMQKLLNPNNENHISLTEFDDRALENNKIEKVYDAVYEGLREVYEEDIYSDELKEKLGFDKNPQLREAYANYWENIKSSWDSVKALTNEYLKSFDIVQGIEDESGYINRLEVENYSNKEYIDDRKYFMNDAKSTASRSIKLLFATLPETVFTVSGIESKRSIETLMQQQVNYSKTFNQVLTQLLPYNTYTEKIAKLEELAAKFPNIKRLYQRLSTNSGNVMNDWKLKIRFYQAMSKQEPTAWIQYNQEGGKISFTQTANLEDSKKIIIQSWLDGLKTIATEGTNPKLTISVRGELLLITKGWNFNIASLKDKINFLEQFNIPFTEEMYNNSSSEQKANFNDGVTGLAFQLKRKDNYILENAKSLEAIGNLESIAEAFIKAGNDFETQFYNIDGERQTTRISTNAVSRWGNDFNNAQTREELLKTLPHLEDIDDSLYINSQLFGEKTGEHTSFKLDIGYIQGTVDENGKPIPGNRLGLSDRLNQEINQNLNKRYYILVPADSKTQWLLTMKNIVSYKMVATKSGDYEEKVKGLFTKYYQTEKTQYEKLKETIGEDKVKERFGAFKEISDSYALSEEEFYKRIGTFFNNQIEDQIAALKDLQIIKLNKDNKTYSWKALDGDFIEKNSAYLSSDKLSEKNIIDILTFRTINYAINNIEMHKMFFGTTLAYKDAKRYKLFLSPREVSMYGDKDYNNFLNQELNKAGEIVLNNNLLGKHKFSDNINTALLSDVKTANETLAEISKKYLDTNITDAQAWSTVIGARERRLKNGSWFEKDEAQFQYSQAVDRQLMLKDGILNKTSYPENLQEHDASIVEKSNPNLSYVYVEKPILSGHVNQNGEWTPITDKFSIVSFSYAAIRDTNFREHYIKMLKQDIGYIIVPSGRKTGQGETNDFYNAEGLPNTEPYKAITLVPFSAFGVQTDTSSKKESQTRGSQITKLILLNLYDNGVPIHAKAHELAQQNLALLREQTEIGYQKLLKKIGAEDADGVYRIKDKSKIVNLVKNELLRREVTEALKKLISIDPKTDDLTIPFEALPNYVQIKNILYSFVDKNIVHPKINGAPKVQVSGALMEKYGVKREFYKGKSVLVSGGLHMYTKEEPWMGVIMPFHAAKKLRDAGLKWNNTDELMALIKASPDAQQILSGIGFRIPTQELNSMENMRVEGFLPEEFGDSVILPEGITTKSGGDFDIDKLSTYLPNIYINNKKEIRVVPYFGIGEHSQIQLKKWLTQDIAEDFLLNEKKINPAKYDSFEEYQLAQPIEELSEKEIEATQDELVERLYQQSIENEYIKNMGEILSLPENFERLVKPNNVDTLSDIRDQLVDLSEVFDSSLNSSIVSPMFMLKTRHDGVSIGSLIGIAAVSQTRIATSQLSKIIIDPKRIKNLDYREQAYLPNNAQPLLPHNKVEGVATLSSIKDREGYYISDNNSEYINGTVDVFNDAFLAQLNYNRETAPIYHLMVGLGIPNSTAHPVISFFMNQPIIRQYLKRLQINGKNYTIDQKSITETRQQFKSTKGAYSFTQDIKTLTDELRSSIKTYYNGGELSNEDNGKQQLILTEFLKYATLANNLYRFQQGSNYDTARMNDANSTYFKERQKTNAEIKNIFSDVNTYLNNSGIGAQRKAVLSIGNAYTDVLPVQSFEVQQYLQEILNKISDKYISLDEKNKIAGKLERTLFDWLIHTRTGINNSYANMMVNPETALINEIKKFKKYKKEGDTDTIWGNTILQNLIPSIKGRTSLSTKNITLAVKAKDVFSKNLDNQAFEELYNHPKTADFARSLIKLSFLQSGISQSRISYKDAIPPYIFANTVNAIMDDLKTPSILQNFLDSGAFYKNNWNDEDIVPQVTSNEFQLSGYKPFSNFFQSLKTQGVISEGQKPPALLWVTGHNSYSPFLTHTDFIEEGDNTLAIKRLFQRVSDGTDQGAIRIDLEDEENPGTTRKATLFVQVSAWGDSDRAQEHYETNRASVFQNGYSRPLTEIDPRIAYNYIRYGVVDNSPTTEPAKGVDDFEKLKNQLPKKDCN